MDRRATDLPTGTVTFLFTDVESSTSQWERAPHEMRRALERHDELMRDAFDRHGGYVFATGGDAFCVAFARVADGVQAAVGLQRDLSAEPWPEAAPIRVRMGLHTGEAFERNGDYFGPAVNRAARVMSIAKGGQVLCSAVTAQISGQWLPEGCSFDPKGTARLKGLEAPESLFGIEGPGLPSGFAPLPEQGTRGNLTPLPIRLIGRGIEVEEVAVSVTEHRLVSLIGAGGVGKTSLATVAADAVTDKFRDGVWMVELASVSTSEGVVRAVAASTGVEDTGQGPLIDGLRVAFAPLRALVVLDNAEHVVDGVVSLLRTLGPHCPDVTWLVTSRERLGLAWEHPIGVAPLPADSAGSAAVELFLERAGRPDLVEGDELDAVVEICGRLDGLPLAVELAAARCRTMRPSEVRARLGTSFRLLVDKRSDDVRRATVDGMVRWSYELLDPPQQRALRWLGTFVGGFDLEDAELVLATDGFDELDVDDAVSSLVDKSLVVNDGGWYRLLETTRAFALDRLAETGELGEARRAHLERFVRLGAISEDCILSGDAMWLDRIDREWPNVRRAFESALELGDEQSAPELVGGFLLEIWIRRPDAMGWGALVAERFGAESSSPPVIALAIWHAVLNADATTAAALVGAQPAPGSPIRDLLFLEVVRSIGLMMQMQYDEARARLADVMARGEALGDIRAALTAAFTLSTILFDEASRATYRPLVETAARNALGLSAGPAMLGTLEVTLGTTLALAGESTEADMYLRSAIPRLRAERHSQMESHALIHLQSVSEPDLDSAVAGLVESARRGNATYAWGLVLAAARALVVQGDRMLPALAIGAASATAPGSSWVHSLPMAGAMVEQLRAELGSEEYERLVAEGGELDLARITARLREAADRQAVTGS